MILHRIFRPYMYKLRSRNNQTGVKFNAIGTRRSILKIFFKILVSVSSHINLNVEGFFWLSLFVLIAG